MRALFCVTRYTTSRFLSTIIRSSTSLPDSDADVVQALNKMISWGHFCRLPRPLCSFFKQNDFPPFTIMAVSIYCSVHHSGRIQGDEVANFRSKKRVVVIIPS
jgi:hypothetical protein